MAEVVMITYHTDGCTYNFENFQPIVCESKQGLVEAFETAYILSNGKGFEFCGEEFSKYSLEELCGFPEFYTIDEWFKKKAITI